MLLFDHFFFFCCVLISGGKKKKLLSFSFILCFLLGLLTVYEGIAGCRRDGFGKSTDVEHRPAEAALF